MLEPEKVKQILQMDDAQRAVYFVNETVTQNQLWILTDEHGCVMLNTEEEDCVPVWQNCQPEAISLNKWFSRWTHGLADDELAIVVFPSQDEQGLVYYPDELEHELKQHSVKKR